MTSTKEEPQYYAHYNNPPEDEPWALFVTLGPRALRYVKHRDEYVELRENWDFISGHSSESMGVRRITPEEAEALQADIPDVEPAVVTYFGG